MADRPHLTRLVVAVPARNEANHIERCISSILDATGCVPGSVTVNVIVACDSCTDQTVEITRRLASRSPHVEVVTGEWGTPGGARRAAIDVALGSMPTDADRVWFATTDADTAVPTDWLCRHIVYADTGFDAVAGVVELAPDADRSITVVAAFNGYYRFDTVEAHSHVHGANLGVRANRYLEAGGFPPLSCSEDHALWNALGKLPECRRLSPTALVVYTSARLHSRTRGGFADDLAKAVA